MKGASPHSSMPKNTEKGSSSNKHALRGYHIQYSMLKKVTIKVKLNIKVFYILIYRNCAKN